MKTRTVPGRFGAAAALALLVALAEPAALPQGDVLSEDGGSPW